MANAPVFNSGALENIAAAIGDAINTRGVFELLQSLGVRSVEESSKARTIKSSLMQEQRRTGSGDCVISFMKTALSPQRWAGKQVEFEKLRAEVNATLIFAGLEIRQDGKCARRKAAATHDEAALATSRRLLAELERRGGHAEVFKYCRKELVAEDCFNAVFEATKGLAERVRKLTGLDLDGHDLVAAALEGKDPIVKLNSRESVTERNEQRGIANLMKGAFSAFRNPSSHEPKVLWPISEADALDLLSTLSLIHRRFDNAVVVAPGL